MKNWGEGMGGKVTTIWGFLAVMVLLSGCATNSIFSSYPSQVENIKLQVSIGDFAGAQAVLAKKSMGADIMLYLMERGRISQMAGDTEESIQDFQTVLEAFEAKEAAAKITASGVASGAGAVMLNENAIPYQGDIYERVFVHSFQALNFLAERNLDAAAVEVRRANLEQKFALQENENELIEAEEEDEKAKILSANKGYKSKFPALATIAGTVKNSFQNAYSFYISGLIYEINGDANDAYIDYKKALEIYPGNSYIRGDVARLAKRLSMEEDFEQIKDSVSPARMTSPAEGEGKLVVLYEQGYVPERQEVNVLFDIMGVPNNMVFPTYSERAPPARSLVIGLAGERLGETETVVQPSAMAARALSDRMPGMIVRQGLRIIAREKMKDNQLTSTFGVLAGLGQFFLNRADLRSWLMLPAEVQIMHAPARHGEQILTLRNGSVSSEVVINIQPGRTTVVHVIEAGGQLHSRAVTI
ncbi:MAG: hypothetical protein L3J89_14285 [Gammaproteobacteria bacterium]|nr:hypothetical protein [Gammaproteobacteria bacterium]